MKGVVISIAMVFALIVSGIGMMTAVATPVYNHYREELLSGYGTAIVDGNFTTTNEYGVNDWNNPGMTARYINESNVTYTTPNEVYIYFMNDDDNAYIMLDVCTHNTSEYELIVVYIDTNRNGTWNSSEDFGYMAENHLGGSSTIPTTVTVGNASGYWSSPNANYSHSIWELAIPLSAIDTEPGEMFSVILAGFVTLDGLWVFPDEVVVPSFAHWLNVTTSEKPMIEIEDEYLIYESVGYGFESDVYFKLSISQNLTFDLNDTFTASIDSNWFAKDSTHYNFDFTDSIITDCYINFTVKYEGVAYQVGGFFSDLIVYVWIDNEKYSIGADSNIGYDNGAYSLVIPVDSEITQLEFIVNPGFKSEIRNWFSHDLA